MTEENKRKNKIIGISIGMLIILLVVISSTYAYWQITRSQTDPNVLKAACLDLKVEFGTSLSLQSEWPIESSEALRDLTGYTFTVTSTCEEETNYVIGLESVLDEKITEYMANSSVALAIDDQVLGTYDTLSDLEGPTEGALASKELITSTIKKGETNTHSLKIWIDIAAPITEQSKGFAGRVFITGGQGVENDNPLAEVTKDECFEITSDGEIIGYDEACGTKVTIPNTVNSIAVKKIDSNAFKGISVLETTLTSNYELDKANYSIVVDEGLFETYEGDAYYFVVYEDNENVQTQIANMKASAQSIGITHEIPVYNVGDENVTELKEGQEQLYFYAHSEGFDQIAVSKLTTKNLVMIEELDLSKAYNLELIEPRAFTNYDTGINDVSAFIEQQNNKPVSLTSLTFGKINNALEIGWGAFDGINVDNLTVYSNMYGMEITLDEYWQENYTIGYFAGAQIDTLNVEYVEGYPVGGDGGLYSYIKANQVNIGEGITEIATSAFGTLEKSNSFIENVLLPSSITKINTWAFRNQKNISFVAGNCDNVEINRSAWSTNTVVTPNTCVLGQNVD